MRSVLRTAVLPLVAVAAILLFSAVPAAAAPAPTLSVAGLKVGDGKVSFVVTPRYVTTQVGLASVQVRVGQMQLGVVLAPAVSDIAPRTMVVVVDASSSVTPDQLAQERSTATTIANGLPTDATLGLVVIGSKSPVVLAPATDRGAFVNALAGLAPGGKEALVDAVDTAGGMFGDDPATERRLLIIGPGADESSTSDSAGQGSQLAKAGVVTDAIVTAPDTPAAISAIVSPGGGQTLPAADAEGFTTAASTESMVFAPAVEVTATIPPSLAGTQSQLDISLQVKAGSLTASQPVTFGGTPPGAAGSQSASTALSWVPAWAGWAFGVVLFVGLIIVVLTIAWPRSFKHERIKQIANFGPGARNTHAQKQVSEATVPSVIARTALAATASVVRSGRLEERIARRLERAGIRMRAHEWVLLRVCIVVAGGALLFAVAGIVGGLIGAGIGYLSTLLYQTVRTDRRANQFAEQLPDALQLVIGSLKSGFSLPQAFDSLVREAPEPVASEFGRALSEHRLGADISDALERLAQRVESEDLGWAVMAVRIQREVGGNLAEVLQTTVDTMRERSRLRRHVSSLSAEGRLSAYVLIGLPIILGLFMFIYRRAYMAPLVTDPLGIIMISLGGLLFILGIFWMTRVIKVEA